MPNKQLCNGRSIHGLHRINLTECFHEKMIICAINYLRFIFLIFNNSFL